MPITGTSHHLDDADINRAQAIGIADMSRSDIRLTAYDAAKRAIAKARSVDEVKKIKREADQRRAYAKIAKDKHMLIDAEEIRARATRRLGQLMQAQAATVGQAKPPGSNQYARKDRVSEKPDAPATLTEAGIDKNLADRARKLAKLADDAFEHKVDQWRDDAQADSGLIVPDLLKPHVHRALGTGENEWYTPQDYLDAVRDVLGSIDLDPASSRIAQRAVKAAAYFTTDDDGLTKEWRGRVWLNPPYAQPDIADFVAKLITEYRAGHVTEAIMLTHNFTCTRWFYQAATAARAFCLTLGRIRFVDPDGNLASPTNGQCFFYFGHRPDAFAARFADIGFVAGPWGDAVDDRSRPCPIHARTGAAP
jgi:phage N-6-adenine-methyltransferase